MQHSYFSPERCHIISTVGMSCWPLFGKVSLCLLALQNTALLLRELQTCVPNSEVRDRMHVELKKIIPEAVGRDFTDIIVIHEDRKEPSILLVVTITVWAPPLFCCFCLAGPTDGLLLIHLPDGPTAHFKLTNFRRGYDIKVSAPVCSYFA